MEKSARSSYKPHFFQPILPGSSSAHLLPIPKAFQRDYLVNGEDSEGVATLKSPLKSWKVKLKEFKFTDGWADFFKAHNLSMGNFLVFQYEGHDLIFYVWVFDSSSCEVVYSTPPLMSDHGQLSAKSIGKGKGKNKAKGKKEATFSDEELNDDATSISKYPHFHVTLKGYNIGRSYLAIPPVFWRSNIPHDVGGVLLKDEEGIEWPIKLTRRKDGYGVIFGCGWYTFEAEKGLKVGDICLFEQEDEDQMEFTVNIIRK